MQTQAEGNTNTVSSRSNVPKHRYDGYIPEGTVPGNTIRWGSWRDTASGEYQLPITLFPYASGSDYSGNTVELSNYRVLTEDEHIMSRSVLIAGGYGTFGVAYIGYPTRHISALVASLESYPVLDDSHHSELEMELEIQQWNEWGRAEFCRDIEGGWRFDFLDDVTGDTTGTGATPEAARDKLLDGTWWSFAEQHGDFGRVFEGSGFHFYVDHAITWLKKERTFRIADGEGDVLALGHTTYEDRHTLSVARDAGLEGRREECCSLLKSAGLTLIDLEAEDKGNE